jgi:hypothetical protein
MDFDEMNNFLSTRNVGGQDARLRIRKRGLESRERKLLGTVSSVYGFDIFLCCSAALAPFLDNVSPRSATMALAAGGVGVALVFALAIYRVWRNPPPSAMLIAIPGLLFAIPSLFSGGLSMTIFSSLNIGALVALYSLHKTWNELKEISCQASGMDTKTVEVEG